MILVVVLGRAAGCGRLDERCLSCEGAVCQVCFGSFPSEAGGCVAPKSAIPHCQLYSDETVCSSCELGFFLEGNRCVRVAVEGCAVAKSSDQCKSCFGAEAPNEQGKCGGGVSCPPRCRFCTMRKDVPSCVMCEEGFAIEYDRNGVGKCIDSSLRVKDCMIQGKTRCLVCAYGFFMFEGLCVRSKAYVFALAASARALSAALLALALLFV